MNLGWVGLLWVVVVRGALVIGNSSESVRIVPFNGKGNVSFPVSLRMCKSSSLNLSDFETKVVLFVGEPRATYTISKSFHAKLLQYQTNPAILGVIVFDVKKSPGYLGYYMTIPKDISLPVWLVGKGALPVGSVGEEGVMVGIDGIEANDWLEHYGASLFWFISLLLGNLICIGLATVTLLFLFKTGKKSSMATICLIFDIIGEILRILDLVLVWWLGPYDEAKLCITISFVFLLSSSGLLIFFWLDVTSGSLYTGKFLDTMKIPASLFIGLLFINEVSLDVANFYLDIPLARTAVYIIYGVLCFFLGVLYFLVAYKLGKVIQVNHVGEYLKSINFKARICGGLFLELFVIGLVLVLPGSTDNYTTFRVFWYIMFVSLIVVSIIQITIFLPSRATLTSTFSAHSQSQASQRPSLQSHE